VRDRAVRGVQLKADDDSVPELVRYSRPAC
jgi:hypothetical protein